MAGSDVKEEYRSSLTDLTFNSKPLISVLTILAEENIAHAKDIVEAIETHLSRVRVEVKLPILYLIDCIVKNVGGPYTALFCQNIVSTFCSVFEKVDEKTRAEMFRLRQTWNDLIPAKKLYALDVQITQLDPAWPVTAPTPSSIHFNPKFLKNTPTTVSGSTATTTTKTNATSLIDTNIAALNPETISMHQKLIDKQKELLELQQRKLELELLQTQVKYQEQLKNHSGVVTTTASKVPHSQNLLLKPEVAKQLTVSSTISKNVNNTTNLKSKSGTHMSSVMSSKLQNNSTVGGPRIAPVSSGLAHARPIRDPRLLRHQQQQQQTAPAATINSNIQLDKSGTQVTVESDNKIVNNKTSVRNDRDEHRLVNNKGNIESHGKSKTLPHSSPSKHIQKIGSSVHKVDGKFSRDSKSTSSSLTDLTDSKGSSSSLGSPSKSSRGDSSSQKNRSSSSKLSSLLKSKKKGSSMRSDKDSGSSSRTEKDLDKDTASTRYDKSGTSSRSDKDSTSMGRGDKKSDKHSSKSSKSDKDNGKQRKSDSSSAFKDLKGTTKNRNYIRRNRNTSASPELNHDVDLRMGAPPEKQPRLQGDINDDKSTSVDTPSQNKDVDLRQLPAVIGKKRSSTESHEPPTAKKSKSEMFDVLFGHEDTDLRQLPPVGVDRPPTPPPPIISDKVEKAKSDHHELKNAVSEKREAQSKNLSLDAVRVKLANAINQDKLKESKDIDMHEDTDMRRKLPSFVNRKDASMNKIIISQADEECIKAGNMTKAQETALMNKIIAQIETQKLREAQQKESETVGDGGSILLQPISDDELEGDFSGNESDEGAQKKVTGASGDTEPKKEKSKEDRDAPVPPQISQLEGMYPKFSRDMDHRDPRRGRLWRGRSRKGWDALPPIGPMPRPGLRPGFRPALDPWIRPMHYDSWRTGPNSMNPLYPNSYGPEQIGPNIPSYLVNEQGGLSPNSNSQDIPALEYAHPDSYKYITIDSVGREIRYYDETAIVFMNSDDPREITFHNGTRRIYFDDEPHTLKLNSPYEEISIKGNVHRVRLGAPSREIFIDGKGYECYFDEKEKTIELDGNTVLVKLEPPPPQVKIGEKTRTDLVAGKIQMVVDAKNMFTVFLDAKVQTFQIDGIVNTLKFVDALKAALINDVRFEISFGGLPKPIMLRETKRFIRFSVLPKGIKQGHVKIKDMEGYQPCTSPRIDENSQDSQPSLNTLLLSDQSESVIKRKPFEGDSPDRNSNSPHLLQSLMPTQNLNNLDMLSSVMASSMAPNSSETGYKVEDTTVANLSPNTSLTTALPTVQVTTPPAFDIANLFQRLVATGIVTTMAPIQPKSEDAQPNPVTIESNALPNLKPVTFNKPETLKSRRPQSIQSLYQGIQCSSCGMRFPPGQDNYYKQHLDWHFRQNRKGKKNNRKTSNRRWYYSFSDWKNYEEIEDPEEREKNYFENQQQNQGEGANEEGEEEIEIPCAPADPDVQDPTCEVCQDKFEQFYNEEKEEWQLRMAIRVDGKTYHPLCYEDYQASLVDLSLEESKLNELINEEGNELNSVIPGLELKDDPEREKVENDEDDVMEVIDNIDDEESSNVGSKTDETEEKIVEKVEENDEDDDVIINEVVPEKIVVDDDDKDDYVPSEQGSLIPGVIVKQEPIDDGFVDVENGLVRLKSNEVKIKSEPIDPDDVGVILPEEKTTTTMMTEAADTTHIEVVSSMDGNVELDPGVPPTSTSIGGKIKINITKPLPAIVPRENKDVVNDELKTDCIDPSQPLPPGEEPVQLNLKPALQGLELKRQPMVRKGSELTGLCSIM